MTPLSFFPMRRYREEGKAGHKIGWKHFEGRLGQVEQGYRRKSFALVGDARLGIF